MIFDTHEHYDDPRYGDLDHVVDEMRRNGVEAILTCATDYASCETVLKLAGQYDLFYAAVGIYPHDIIKQGRWDADRLRAYARHPKVVAIGEIGLDYHYDDTPRQMQKDWLCRQLALANELQLPVSFHDRDAHGDTLELLRQYRPKGVLHCFSGSVEMAREITKLGMYLGIGGVVTFKNARVLKQVVQAIDLEMLVLETDAPYMTPEPLRGQTNRSDYIIYIARQVAQLKGLPVEQVLQITEQNARRVFQLKPKP